MDERLSDYVRGQWPALVRYATLVSGDAAQGEELAQAALVRVAARWPFVRDKDNPDLYVKRAIVNAQRNVWRRLRSRETPVSEVPEVAVDIDAIAAVDDHELIRRALAQLPRRQRAVLVMRYLDDWSEQQTAAALGCSVGTVKSQASKGLVKMRALLAVAPSAASLDPSAEGRER